MRLGGRVVKEDPKSYQYSTDFLDIPVIADLANGDARLYKFSRIGQQDVFFVVQSGGRNRVQGGRSA